MLVRRIIDALIISRPSTTLLRRNSHLQIPSTSQTQVLLPRPNTWLAKIRFRPDGKPRSKLIALGIGCLILFDLSLVYEIRKAIETGEKVRGFLARIAHIYHMDTTYDSVNFDDPISTLSYFKEIYQSYSQGSKEEVDRTFTKLMGVFKMRTEKGSGTSAEFQAHYIMRSAAEKIHVTFRELNRDTYSATVLSVMCVMQEAMDSLAQLLQSCIDEDRTSEHPPVDSRS